ncbi:MAG: bifunctional riboflavin kinase/FAD synthetase [Rhodoluna sp.]|nr:bifunctional riboflavin kinase/FAD synthetase [Rhodoluna sp.]
MITVSSTAEIPAGLPESSITIGKFDGVHLGHQQLLAEAIESADEHLLIPVVVTFDRHPHSILSPGTEPQALIGQNQKSELLEQAGIELVLNLPFDQYLSQLTPEEFVRTVLVESLKAKIVTIGQGFRFGVDQKGDVETLKDLGKQLGFHVRVIPNYLVDGEVVSTSRIRALLLEGNVKGAAKLLGRLHSTQGVIEHGLKIGRQIGFPTANMSRDAEGFLPLDAVYAGWLYADGERYMTAISVGINETFEAVPRLLEAHVIDVKGLDLYDKIITVEYVDFIRLAAKFDGVESLVAAINKDLDQIRAILS